MVRARESGPEVLDEALGRLYRVPPSRFVAERKAMVAELRAKGAVAASAKIAQVRRPGPTAWAVNQVALAHPGLLRAFGEAVEALRTAQGRAFRSDGDAAARFAAARAELKDRSRDVVQAARDAMTAERLGWTPEAQRRVAKTLHAVPFASPDDRARLFAGRLERDLDAAADFGALAGDTPVEDDPKEEKGSEANRRKNRETRDHPEKREQGETKAQARAQREALERARAEALKRARAEELERARVEAKARAVAHARTKKLVARAHAAQSEAERLEAQALKAEAGAAKARMTAEAARAAAVQARDEATEASAKR